MLYEGDCFGESALLDLLHPDTEGGGDADAPPGEEAGPGEGGKGRQGGRRPSPGSAGQSGHGQHAYAQHAAGGGDAAAAAAAAATAEAASASASASVSSASPTPGSQPSQQASAALKASHSSRLAAGPTLVRAVGHVVVSRLAAADAAPILRAAAVSEDAVKHKAAFLRGVALFRYVGGEGGGEGAQAAFLRGVALFRPPAATCTLP